VADDTDKKTPDTKGMFGFQQAPIAIEPVERERYYLHPEASKGVTRAESMERIQQIQEVSGWLPYIGQPQHPDGHPQQIHSLGNEPDDKGEVKQVFTLEPIPPLIGSRIRYVREDHGLRQVELGNMMGVAQSTIGAWESGDLFPKKILMNWFCELFGVAAGWLWLGDRAQEFESSKLMEMINSEDKSHSTVAKIVAIVSHLQGDRKPGDEVLQSSKGYLLQGTAKAPGGGKTNLGSATVKLTTGVSAEGSVGEASIAVKDIPLLGTTAAAGPDGPAFIFNRDTENGMIDKVTRPVGIAHAKEVYAIQVMGDSMSPKHEDGDILIVSIRRNPRPGDSVILQLFENREAPDDNNLVSQVKELVKKSPEVTILKQYGPEPGEIIIKNNHIKRTDRVYSFQELCGFS